MKLCGGGGARLNSNPIATFPVNALYISNNQISPASLFGGTWTCLAENINLPLNNIVPIITMGYDVIGGEQNPINIKNIYTGKCVNYPIPLSTNYQGHIGLKNVNEISTGNGTAIDEQIYFSNLAADFSQSTTKIIVSLWQRLS